MWEGIPVAIAETIGVGGLLSIAILLVLAGRLVPRSTHREIVDMLEAALKREQERGAARDEQLAELLRVQQRTIDILEALQRRAGGDVENDSKAPGLDVRE